MRLSLIVKQSINESIASMSRNEGMAYDGSIAQSPDLIGGIAQTGASGSRPKAVQIVLPDSEITLARYAI